jgi:hypothetical protein
MTDRQRILDCLDALRDEEDRALGRNDWAGLSEVFDRGSALVGKLVAENEQPGSPASARILALIESLRRLDERIDEHRIAMRAELDQLRAARRRTQAVQGAYARN